ncbi:MAG: nucleotide exchange factor GrpE [Candidatus Omnitrophica bacterium CG11_big_fil_rev_8_21_14_0_20_42_13]|uniref:Protein GrpE n=1 Tax=Candidatus Ghiorseimicrobium undicola TaxID=1974746 RepID=A0A2H0LVB0_9BACT|nr:MAG: nucleotide exchange factor GrpE [Candidatus Omnitrophica bacterium CG11_big_fil_rev_8_21_14_0_20_42_13]
MSEEKKEQSISGEKNGRKETSHKNNLRQEHQDNKAMISIPKDEYEVLNSEAKKAVENWDKLLRAQAEFENIKKRMEKEKQDFIKFANEALIAELLVVLDDLERSVCLAEQNKNDPLAFLKGIELVLGHFYEIMKKRGLSPIDTEGKLFDPQLHEALLHIENNNLPEHTIVEELQKGYFLNGRVIRTSKVKVSKKSGGI